MSGITFHSSASPVFLHLIVALFIPTALNAGCDSAHEDTVESVGNVEKLRPVSPDVPAEGTSADDNLPIKGSAVRGQAILERLDELVVYDAHAKQLTPLDDSIPLDDEVEELMHVTNALLSGNGAIASPSPDVVAAFIERWGVDDFRIDQATSAPAFCAPIKCGGYFATGDAVKNWLKNSGYHNVSQSWYGGSEWDYAKATQGCSLFFSEPKRNEAVVCRTNCKGSCYKSGTWTYYVELNEPDPEGAWCATAAWISWTAYYHAVC